MVAIEFNGQGNQWHALLKNCLNLSLALQPTPEVCFFFVILPKYPKKRFDRITMSRYPQLNSQCCITFCSSVTFILIPLLEIFAM